MRFQGRLLTTASPPPPRLRSSPSHSPTCPCSLALSGSSGSQVLGFTAPSAHLHRAAFLLLGNQSAVFRGLVWAGRAQVLDCTGPPPSSCQLSWGAVGLPWLSSHLWKGEWWGPRTAPPAPYGALPHMFPGPLVLLHTGPRKPEQG